MASQKIALELSHDQKILIDPCECCENTTIVVSTPSYIVKLEGLNPHDLVLLSQKLEHVADDQAFKEIEEDFDPEMN